MSKPLLSICIPVFNAAHTLAECLAPLLAMGPGAEIILSDDGSSDDSYEICLEYARTHENVIALTGANGGPSAARNRAMERITGEYTVFVDADDVLETRTLACLSELCRSGEVGFVQFGVVSEFTWGSAKKPLLYDAPTALNDEQFRELFAFTCGYHDARDLGADYFGLVTCKIFKSEYLRGLRFDPDVVGEDTLFAVQAMQRVKNAWFLPEYLYHYRNMPNSYSHRPFPNIVPMAARMLKLLYSECDIANNADARLRAAYYYHALGKFNWCLRSTELLQSDGERAKRLRELCEVAEFAEMIAHIDVSALPKQSGAKILLLRMHLYDLVSGHLPIAF